LEHDALFIDTAYIYALFNTRDQWHIKALEWQRKLEFENRPLLTTEFVLVEIADGLSAARFRQRAVNIIHSLRDNPFVRIIPASFELFQNALDLYEKRPDKNWGLTDCASFVVMTENKMIDALTTDDHFRQAGFNALLLD